MTMDDAPRAGITAAWARFGASLDARRIPPEAFEAARALVLDSLGTALAAGTLGASCDAALRVVRASGGAPQATVIGHGDRVAMPMAAFANGALVHALNFDANGPMGGHLAVAALPAPLAIAEARGSVSGTEFVVSVILAAEFTARLAAALRSAGVDANEKFLEGQLLGYFGGALGGARAAGLDAATTASALGLALAQCGGTRQLSFEGRAGKAIYGAYAAQGATMAVLLAEAGVDGACEAIEGRAGLYALCYGGRYDAAMLTPPTDRYLMTDTVFKPWPTSEMAHPFIRAALELRKQPGYEVTRIARVRITTGPHAQAWLEPAAARKRPTDAATAANSLYFAVATALVDGTVSLGAFTKSEMTREAVLRIADRMDYVVDASVGEGARLECTMSDGEMITGAASAGAMQMDFDAVARKFADCARFAPRALAQSRVDEIVERVAKLESMMDAGLLARLCAGAPAAGSKM